MVECWAAVVQVVAEARRLGAYSVRGNHDDSALAAYRALQQDKHAEIDVRSQPRPHLLPMAVLASRHAAGQSMSSLTWRWAFSKRF